MMIFVYIKPIRQLEFSVSCVDSLEPLNAATLVPLSILKIQFTQTPCPLIIDATQPSHPQ